MISPEVLQLYFKSHKSKFYILFTKQFKEEDIWNESCAHNRVTDYYLAFSLVAIIAREIEEGLFSTWSDVIEKFNLIELDECFACKGISLSKIFAEYGFPFTDCDCGIECMGFHISFEIEPDCNPCIGCNYTQLTPTYNIQDLIDNPTTCVNTLIN